MTYIFRNNYCSITFNKVITFNKIRNTKTDADYIKIISWYLVIFLHKLKKYIFFHC